MSKNCNDKNKFVTAEASSKASLRTKGAIDRYLNIIDLNLFRTLNTEWSNDAKKRFNISERLFFEENNKALPNTSAFKQIDNAKNIFYKESNDNIKNIILNIDNNIIDKTKKCK